MCLSYREDVAEQTVRPRILKRAMAAQIMRRVVAGVHWRKAIPMIKKEQAERMRMGINRKDESERLFLLLSRMLLKESSKEVRYLLARCINDLFP